MLIFIISFVSYNIIMAAEHSPSRIEIPSDFARSIFVAEDHFKVRQDFTAEQRDLKNYDVWVTKTERGFEVDFVPVMRSGERVKGDGLDYARGTRYIISPETFKILQVYGSK